MERKTGARGLRSILEKTMMKVMYTIPSDETIEECVITKAAVEGKEEPVVHRKKRNPAADIRVPGKNTN